MINLMLLEISFELYNRTTNKIFKIYLHASFKLLHFKNYDDVLSKIFDPKIN
jgi:hypothetical protein